MTPETKRETAVEDIKRSSNYLRGEISRELDNDVAKVSNESEQILKFHGIYAQDNRDVCRERAELHADGSSTEGFDWRPRIRGLLGDSEPSR